MNDIKEKMKIWVEMMESENLEDVLKDIQMNIHVPPDIKWNKCIFKLLLYLSHTADKCNKQNGNKATGKQIAKLAKLLCSLLIEVPDDKTYVISLYHVVRCLVSLNLYEDAAEICCYLQPGNLYSPKNDTMGLLAKIVSLWRFPINNIYSLATDSLTIEKYSDLKNIIRYEMKMIQIAYKNYTQHLIMRISIHIDKMAIIDKGKDMYFDDFYKYLLEYLTEVQLCLNKDEKYIIYCCILRIICYIICKDINISHIKHVIKTLNKLCNYFKNLLIEDEECYQCFQQFQSLCEILLTPIENFVNESAKSIQNLIICDKKIVQKYGYTECLKSNALRIADISEPMFTYWETYIKIYKQKFLDTGIILETIRLMIHMSVFFMKDVSDKCKTCLNENCAVKRDLYNTVVLKCRCIHFLTKFPTKTLPEKLCVFAGKILEQCVLLISEIKEYNCNRWSQLWATCGALIYNMAIASEHIYEENVHLFSLLCTCIFQFQGVESEINYLSIKNPTFSILHRLCASHYTNQMYREAMTVSALNALLTYNTQYTKAFDMWVNIKKKCASEKIAQLTILECLRDDKDKINEIGFTIDFSKYDLIQLCMREAQSLLEEKIAFTDGVSAVLQEFRKLKPTNCQYAHMIQLLGFYLLGPEHNSLVLEYHEQAISNLKEDKLNSVAMLCLEVNLAFFKFVEELYTMNKQTLMEMENTKFALYAPKLPEVRETKSPAVVPAYTMLNINKDSRLMLSLQKCLKKWNKLLKYEMLNEIIKNWQPKLLLHMLVTFGEYCRIYRNEKCEGETWELAYKLASEINDYSTIIYVTGRSISLRQINYNWIIAAKEYAMKHRDSKDGNVIRAIAIFWISLADFYFQCGKCDEAKKLLNNARNFPGISFLTNTSVYLFSLDTIICNCNLYGDNIGHEDYSSYIVESLYTMINLSQNLPICKIQAENLFNYDVLFTATINLSLRVNHLLSFREISAHLVRRVRSAQSLGAVMRTAELLKSLCYIDLSRTKLDDCEVKLQGLEHMLDIETFQLSMNLQPNPEAFTHLAVSPTKIVDPVRDVPQQGASPVLGKKVFDLPKFVLHKNCSCYKCENMSYQYLVFTATYIRAQLCALQCHNTVALDHFYGAFKIRQKLFGEEETVLPGIQPYDEISVKRFSWHARSYITDYVQLLIDFSYFLEANVTSKQQDASDIAHLAINICRKYKLEKHPVYILAKEVVLNNAFQTMLKSPDCLDFMVPQARDIDISKYERAPPNSNDCVTPSAHNRYVKKPASIRRKRNPVVLNLEKISMSLSDDEESDASSSTAAYSTRKPKLVEQKLVKRKIWEDDLSDDVSSNTWKESVSIDTKLTNSKTRKSSNTKTGKKSMKHIIHKREVLDKEPNLLHLIEKDEPATMENLDKKMENLKINSSATRTRKARSKEINSELTVENYSKNVDRATTLLKNMVIDEETNVNIDLKVERLNGLSVQNEKTAEEYDGKLSTTTVETLKPNVDDASTLSTGQSKTTRCKSIKLRVNNEVIGVKTRSSLRKIKEKPS